MVYLWLKGWKPFSKKGLWNFHLKISKVNTKHLFSHSQGWWKVQNSCEALCYQPTKKWWGTCPQAPPIPRPMMKKQYRKKVAATYIVYQFFISLKLDISHAEHYTIIFSLTPIFMFRQFYTVWRIGRKNRVRIESISAKKV